MSMIEKPAQRSELRLASVELRDVQVRDASGTGDGSWTMEGYAAVFETSTVLFDVEFWGMQVRMREEIARDAFGPVLAREPLVHLNHGHDMSSAIAATDVTGVGQLELDADFHGLRYFARVDPADPDAIRLAAKMRNGIVKQASFAFTIAREELVEEVETDDGIDQLWRILEVGELYDVCVCAQGAYPTTESHLRSLAAASTRGRAGLDPAGHPHRSSESLAHRVGASRVASPGAGKAGAIAAARARGRLAAAQHTTQEHHQ